MGMGQEKLRPYRALGKVMRHNAVAKLSNARTGIENYEPVHILKAQFDTGRVSPIPHGIGARTGYGPPYSPKSDFHHTKLSP